MILKTIHPAEVGLDGKALAVSYRPDPQQPQLLLVDVAAHATEAEASRIRKSELRLVVVRQRMTVAAMRARVAAEAHERGIDRVAWIGRPSREAGLRAAGDRIAVEDGASAVRRETAIARYR